MAKKITTIFKNYGLSFVLLFLFLSSWALQFLSQIVEISNETREHGKAFTWNDFWPQFLSSTFENWQSEFLQLLTFVFLTSFLIHKNSAESRDGQDRIESKVDKILSKLDNT